VHAGGHTQRGVQHQSQQAAHIDLSDLVQPSSTVSTPELSTDAFDLFSDLALPSGNGEVQPVTVQVLTPIGTYTYWLLPAQALALIHHENIAAHCRTLQYLRFA
jgi:hypothetical protein